LEIIGLAYFWQNQTEINANKIRKINRERCNDTERQNVFLNIRKKISLVFYCEMKQEWGKGSYIDECTRKEKMGIWLKVRIWKLRRIRRGSERGWCPLCLGEEDAKHILLKWPGTYQWREEFACCKWLNINENIAYRKIISCTNEL
jgi:hypothetical protein